MPNQISMIVRQALLTFGGVKDSFQHNFEKLRLLLDRTTAVDVGFKGHELLKSEVWSQPRKAPVTYVDIFEDDTVSVGVFVLKPGMKLPLHDHPHMYGLIKVIAGTVKISSYSVLKVHPNGTHETEKHSPVIVSHIDPCCSLEPQKQNLHEIESVGGPAAFLDVLAPPYGTYVPEYGSRQCTYFQPVMQLGVDKLLLKIVESPSWFWSDSYSYRGPDIDEELMKTQN